MNTIAVIQADLEVTPLGTKSRLASELGGITVLRRTVERLRSAKALQGVYVLCPVDQHKRCEGLLESTGAVVRQYDAPPPPWAPLVKAARKWSLDGWRGGLGGTTSFDEFTDCRVISELIKGIKAEAVLSVPAAAPLIDPTLIDQMVQHGETVKESARLVFTLAPPGMAGVLLEASLVHELAEKSVPLGWILAYKPDSPERDMILQPCCLDIPAELRHATGRLIADTRRAMETVSALCSDGHALDATTIGRELLERESECNEALPREVELELTTEDPYPDALLRPRGGRIPSRGPLDPAIAAHLAAELAHYDDSLVVLGGFGDPLRHPELGAVLETFRPRSKDKPAVFGLAVRTSGVDLDDKLIEMLIAHEVDVLQVSIDAWTADLYSRLQSPADPSAASLDDLIARLDKMTRICQERRAARPILVPDITKSRLNVHEMDEFFDGWRRKVGASTITGISHYAEQCEDLSVMNMAPAAREPCRRLRSRCFVYADGKVAACDQDYRGLHPVGELGKQSLKEIWHGEPLRRLREAQRAQRLNTTPLCATCDEWHRP